MQTLPSAMFLWPSTLALNLASSLALSLASPAHAAPRFVGAPEDVALAEAAWRGATACTGREGRAAPVVELVRRTVPGDYLGVAHTDPADGTLYRIDLNTSPDRHREVVVHEVSHAWVSEGPVALVEGTAELVADCVVRSSPQLAPLQFDDGRALTGLPDLRSWSKPREDAPSELHSVRTDAYVGASRLMRTAARVVGDAALWGERTVDWRTFDETLLAAGPRGAELVAVLRAGPDEQARALADDDRDGLSALAERWNGTSDQTYDTDGDGWWDGAAPPPGAAVVPLDGTPVCAALPARLGGNLRGVEPSHHASRPLPGGSGLVWLTETDNPEATGGLWVEGGASSNGCASSSRVTVWASDPALSGRVEVLHDAVVRSLARSEARYGMGPMRVAVGLGGVTSTVEGDLVLLSTSDVLAALRKEGGLDELGLLAVSLRRAWADGDRDWLGAEAVARSLAR